MKAMQAIKVLSKISGKPITRISREMGKTKQYVNTVIGRGSTPRVDNFVKMLNICGYELCAVPIGKTPPGGIVIDGSDDDSQVAFGGERRTFSSIFDWEMSDKSLSENEVLYRIETENDDDSIYFTASKGTSDADVRWHAEDEMRRHFGKSGASMVKAVNRVDPDSLR